MTQPKQASKHRRGINVQSVLEDISASRYNHTRSEPAFEPSKLMASKNFKLAERRGKENDNDKIYVAGSMSQ